MKKDCPDLPPNKQFPIVEADLARDLGVSKEEIADLRKKHLDLSQCALGKHGMCVSVEGAEVLRQALGLAGKKAVAAAVDSLPAAVLPLALAVVVDKLEGDSDAEKKGAADLAAETSETIEKKAWELPWSEREVVTLYVKLIPVKNTRVLICTEDKGLKGDNQRVRVTSNGNFTRHMEVPAKQRGEGLWEFAGKRLPRQRGRY